MSAASECDQEKESGKIMIMYGDICQKKVPKFCGTRDKDVG